MKKFTVITLAVMLVLSLAACGGTSSSTAPSTSAPSVSAPSTPAPSTPAPSSAITTVADLTGKKIGVQEATTGDIYAEDIEGATIERYKSGFEAVSALAQGKIDAVIIDDQPAAVFAAQNPEIVVLAEPFTVEDYAMCISKDKPELTAAFNTAIKELTADGTVKGILDYYIGKVEGAKPYTSPEGLKLDKGTLVMGTNAQFPPYEFHEGGKIVGVDADLARAICDKLGYVLKIEDMDFNSIITSVQGGKADFGAAGMTVTEDRLKSIDFTASYCTGKQAIIVKK